jgi:molybdopterin-guanine dinucleotide biosynthesis protein A
MPITRQHITALILAGGQSRRFNRGDKAWFKLAGQSLVQRLVYQLKPQVKQLHISANKPQRYRQLGCRVERDTLHNVGPLAGILRALYQIRTPYLYVVPCDCLYLPPTLIKRLSHIRPSVPIRYAQDASGPQYLCALIHKSSRHALRQYLLSDQRPVKRWYAQMPHRAVDFSQETILGNLNQRDTLQRIHHYKSIKCPQK